jgi:hypothetical protein
MSGYNGRNRRTGARGDNSGDRAELEVGFVRAVFALNIAVETRKQTFPSGKFAATRTTSGSVGSFARKLYCPRIRAASEPLPR